MILIDRVAMKEKLNEAKCAVIKAQREAGKAVDMAALAEARYIGACNRLRDLEAEWENLK